MLDLVRQVCITSPYILWGLVVTHFLIGVPYLFISYTLHYVLKRVGPGITGLAQIRGFSGFVGACGVSHIFAVLVLFTLHLDWAYIVVLAITAHLSIKTMVSLWKARNIIIAALVDRISLQKTLVKIGSEAGDRCV